MFIIKWPNMLVRAARFQAKLSLDRVESITSTDLVVIREERDYDVELNTTHYRRQLRSL